MSAENFSALLLKNGSFAFYEKLAGFFTCFLKDDSPFPLDWKTSLGHMLNKSGKVSDLSDYRTIMVDSPFAKLFTIVLHDRLITFFEKNELVSENQNGCRPGRQAADNIFIPNQIREQTSAR